MHCSLTIATSAKARSLIGRCIISCLPLQRVTHDDLERAYLQAASGIVHVVSG